MRWNKIHNYWECVFVNVPFKIVVTDEIEYMKAILYFTAGGVWNEPITSKTFPSIEVAKSEVESFVLDHLAQYSAIVHRECLEAKVMTWRKLKEQLDQIPEDQLDEEIKVLDSDGDWLGCPEIITAQESMWKDTTTNHDCTDSVYITKEDAEIVVEKGKYYLSIEL